MEPNVSGVNSRQRGCQLFRQEALSRPREANSSTSNRVRASLLANFSERLGSSLQTWARSWGWLLKEQCFFRELSSEFGWMCGHSLFSMKSMPRDIPGMKKVDEYADNRTRGPQTSPQKHSLKTYVLFWCHLGLVWGNVKPRAAPGPRGGCRHTSKGRDCEPPPSIHISCQGNWSWKVGSAWPKTLE